MASNNNHTFVFRHTGFVYRHSRGSKERNACRTGEDNPELNSAVDETAVDSITLGFEGTDTVANPLAGFDTAFFFFLLGGIFLKAGRRLCRAQALKS